jgi:hypothetical protein
MCPPLPIGSSNGPSACRGPRASRAQPAALKAAASRPGLVSLALPDLHSAALGVALVQLEACDLQAHDLLHKLRLRLVLRDDDSMIQEFGESELQLLVGYRVVLLIAGVMPDQEARFP